jgi:hypothetical protein
MIVVSFITANHYIEPYTTVVQPRSVLPSAIICCECALTAPSSLQRTISKELCAVGAAQRTVEREARVGRRTRRRGARDRGRRALTQRYGLSVGAPRPRITATRSARLRCRWPGDRDLGNRETVYDRNINNGTNGLAERRDEQ